MTFVSKRERGHIVAMHRNVFDPAGNQAGACVYNNEDGFQFSMHPSGVWAVTHEEQPSLHPRAMMSSNRISYPPHSTASVTSSEWQLEGVRVSFDYQSTSSNFCGC
eukprot:gnl/MRDRNA2_/MRDRNA2_75919_c0_seq2.p1 gnl/MRDRNA2_/MRDRNA2_75919_c0~~gnl/MRDRNA2_/MRDRNA2_75919_c0_seq2.p1  ORF type:complete len:106 (-),score=16.75 gnl/MRDRNA2_/MRDRNA2_75919_c0_seq2:185-502(-)